MTNNEHILDYLDDEFCYQYPDYIMYLPDIFHLTKTELCDLIKKYSDQELKRYMDEIEARDIRRATYRCPMCNIDGDCTGDC